MPALLATVSTTQEISLKPAVLQKLRAELQTYAQLKQDLDDIQAELDTHKATIGAIREKTGEQSLAIDGYKITRVQGVTSTLDKAKFVAQGGTLAQLANATVTKPKKPYEKITCPGESESRGRV